MKICGIQKTTLLDYPGRVACTVFLGGCNFRCPFCQNGEILDGGTEGTDEEEFFSFLKKRKGILDGVCVSGGEPLVHKDLPLFLEKIKKIGYDIKLDTNGSFPDALKALVSEKLIDYVAMDIKNAPERYEKTAGATCDLQKIRESVGFLLSGKIDYEFRTTVVKQLHRAEDMLSIAKWIKRAKRYFLQNFKDSDAVLQKGLSPLSDEELEAFKRFVKPYVPSVRIRGESGN